MGEEVDSQTPFSYRHLVRPTRVYDQAMTFGASQRGTFHAHPRVRTFCGLVLPGSYMEDASLEVCKACAYALAEHEKHPYSVCSY